MASPAFSPQDIDDLDTIAKQLPQGDPRRDKINGLIQNYQTDLLGKKNNPGGALSALGSDLKGAVTGLVQPGGMNSPYPGVTPESGQIAWQQAADEDERQQKAGYSLPYRLATGVSHGFGLNVGGMEDAAKEGDVGGVFGHALAPPAAIAAGELAPRVVPPVVRGVARGTNAVLEHAPASLGTALGAGAGAGVGHLFGMPGLGAELGGGAGFALGKEVLPNLRVPGENFGLKIAPPDSSGLARLPAIQATPAAETGEALATKPTSKTLITPPKAPRMPRVKASTLQQSQALGSPEVAAPAEASTLPQVGEEGSHMKDLNPESVARQYMGNLSNDALRQLGKKYNIEISQAELTQKPQQGSGPGGSLSAADIQANRKITGPRSQFIDRIIESMSPDRIKDFGDMQKEVYLHPNRIQAVGQGYGAPGTQEMVIKTFFPELARP